MEAEQYATDLAVGFKALHPDYDPTSHYGLTALRWEDVIEEDEHNTPKLNVVGRKGQTAWTGPDHPPCILTRDWEVVMLAIQQ